MNEANLFGDEKKQEKEKKGSRTEEEKKITISLNIPMTGFSLFFLLFLLFLFSPLFFCSSSILFLSVRLVVFFVSVLILPLFSLFLLQASTT
jgi:hypothetical protein